MRSRFMASAVLAAAVLVGCNKEESTTATNPATKPTTNPVTGAAGTVTNTGINATGPAVSAATEEWTKKLANVQSLIADKKYDLADKALKELEDHKSTLPKTVADVLPQLRTAVDAGKLTSSVPAIPTRPPTTAPSGAALPGLPK